jgi:hypothetical protein
MRTAALLLQAAAAARSQAPPEATGCPSAEALAGRCAGARRASTGNCVVCVRDSWPECGALAATADGFCQHGGVAPGPPPDGASAGAVAGLAGVLAGAAAGDVLVRGLVGWGVPSHRTVINVVDQFGADPTGAADASGAVQRAVDAAAVLPNGGAVYLPAGNYQVQPGREGIAPAWPLAAWRCAAMR